MDHQTDLQVDFDQEVLQEKPIVWLVFHLQMLCYIAQMNSMATALVEPGLKLEFEI